MAAHETSSNEMMSSEEQLLPLLSRRNHSEDDRNDMRRLVRCALDWTRVLQLCQEQDVYPLAFSNLSAPDFEGPPTAVGDRLRALYRTNAFRNQHKVEELTRVLNALNDHGIPTIPLKGLVLAQSLHHDVSLRATSDTDILVPPNFTEPALKVLVDLGYTLVLPQFQADLERTNIECQLVKECAIGPSLLELHWAILWSSKLDRNALDDLWLEARRQVIFGASAFRMSAEWEFLLLATHAARNQWQGLKWLADIHDLCAVCEIDWARVMQKANVFGWVKIVQTTFAACNRLFKTPVPSEVGVGERPSWLRLYPSKGSELSRMLLPFHWLNGVVPKLRYFWLLVFVQKLGDWKYSHALPRPLRFLYTPFRLARLVGKFSSQMTRSIMPHLK